MKKSFILAAMLGFALIARGQVPESHEVQHQPKAPASKQETCNGKAREVAGDDRETFMAGCLAGNTAPWSLCRSEADSSHLKDEKRRSFMKECVRSHSAVGTFRTI